MPWRPMDSHARPALWIYGSETIRKNAHRVIRALSSAPATQLSSEDFTSTDLIVQFGVEPCRIDLLTGISGIEFEEAWQNRVSIEIDNLEIFILSKKDLLTNKMATGRDKDQGDIIWLTKNQQ